MELWLVRHGETTWNAEQRWQGQSDVPLSATGREQALRLRRRLADVAFDEVWSSPLSRARESATLALPGIEPQTDPLLSEMHFGELEGLNWDEMQPEQRSWLRDWITDPMNVTPRGGESFADVVERAAAFLARFEQREQGRIAVFTHGGWLRAAAMLLLELRDRPPRLAFANASLSRVQLQPRRVVISLNDTGHLDLP